MYLLGDFKIHFRPLLEYASPAWNPTQIGLIETIEKVQRTFTKRLQGFSNSSYKDRLKTLRKQNHEHRRLQYDSSPTFGDKIDVQILTFGPCYRSEKCV